MEPKGDIALVMGSAAHNHRPRGSARGHGPTAHAPVGSGGRSVRRVGRRPRNPRQMHRGRRRSGGGGGGHVTTDQPAHVMRERAPPPTIDNE